MPLYLVMLDAESVYCPASVIWMRYESVVTMLQVRVNGEVVQYAILWQLDRSF